MKLSAGFAALSLLLAFTATVEASSVHDTGIRGYHPHAHHNGSTNIDKGSDNVEKRSGTIKTASPGRCNPVGATCSFNRTFC
jgi:hypothetical protein